jgi:hypothetical protein
MMPIQLVIVVIAALLIEPDYTLQTSYSHCGSSASNSPAGLLLVYVYG